MSRDAAGPHEGQKPETAWKAFRRQGSSFPIFSPFFSFPLLAGLSVSHCASICFSQQGIPELTCPPGLSASKDLQAPSLPVLTPGQRPAAHLNPIRSGSMSAAGAQGCGRQARVVPRLLERAGSQPRSKSKKASALAAVHPLPLWGLHFAGWVESVHYP